MKKFLTALVAMIGILQAGEASARTTRSCMGGYLVTILKVDYIDLRPHRQVWIPPAGTGQTVMSGTCSSANDCRRRAGAQLVHCLRDNWASNRRDANLVVPPTCSTAGNFANVRFFWRTIQRATCCTNRDNKSALVRVEGNVHGNTGCGSTSVGGTSHTRFVLSPGLLIECARIRPTCAVM